MALALLHFHYDIKVLNFDHPQDAEIEMNGVLYFIEMDEGHQNTDQLRDKIKTYYYAAGCYRVLFSMSSRPDRKEESRLEKLFKISAEVLKGKKGRILGCCYSQFLEDGKIWNHKSEEVSL